MSKGKRNERETAAVYERAGYHTFRPQESKFGETDIFGLFDILAVPPTGSNAAVLLVQVKTNRAAGIEAWCHDAMEYASAYVRPQFVVRYDGEPGPHTRSECYRLIEPRQDPMTRRVGVIDEREDGVEDGGDGLADCLARLV